MSIATTHENYAHTWWTPPEWLDWVSATLGPWHDPCPRDWADRPQRSGLKRYWHTAFYCNHPGARGSTKPWWDKFAQSLQHGRGIWCAFNSEQLRHMDPSPFQLPGWLVMPRDRVRFIWGGPDLYKTHKPTGEKVLVRKHGERPKSPGNWTVFWSRVEPAEPPAPCVIVRTGYDVHVSP